jgi:hypothetical protein
MYFVVIHQQRLILETGDIQNIQKHLLSSAIVATLPFPVSSV